MAMYANTPPTLLPEVDNFTGRRKEFSQLLKELALLTDIGGLNAVAEKFFISGEIIKQISHIVLEWLKDQGDRRNEISKFLLEIANIEEVAYYEIKELMKYNLKKF